MTCVWVLGLKATCACGYRESPLAAVGCGGETFGLGPGGGLVGARSPHSPGAIVDEPGDEEQGREGDADADARFGAGAEAGAGWAGAGSLG